MKGANKRRVILGLLAVPVLILLVIYLAYPGLLLRSYVLFQRSRAGFSLRHVDVKDWKTPYLDSSQAGEQRAAQETIVWVHGFGDTKDNLIPLAKRFQGDFRILALDLPGFGESANRREQDLSADFYVAVIIGFLDRLNIDSAHLVGYSMGGMLAAKLAARAPGRVRTLTLLAPAGLIGDQPSDADRLLAEGEIPLVYRDRKALQRLLDLNFNGDSYIPGFAKRALLAEGKRRADLHELIFETLFDPAGAAELANEISSLRMPVLLIWGEDDRILSVSCADQWLRANPDIRLVVVPDVGHALVHQRIDVVERHVRTHLGRTNAGGAPAPR
jgi:pimeloyl-ACP methyl ester carboxylesterase